LSTDCLALQIKRVLNYQLPPRRFFNWWCDGFNVRYAHNSIATQQAEYIGSARTIYTRFIYGVFGREVTKYTVIYGIYIRFWPTLGIHLGAHQTTLTPYPCDMSYVHALYHAGISFLSLSTLA